VSGGIPNAHAWPRLPYRRRMNSPVGGSQRSWWPRRSPRSRRLSYVLGAGWLLLAALGVLQFLIGDDAPEWWLAGLEILLALGLGITFLVQGRNADGDKGQD
jgi:cadmium resistance protein CadD (predicted permease)